MANLFTIVGLTFDVLGAWGIAYELLWGYPKRNRSMIAERKLETEERLHSWLVESANRIPAPDFKETEIKRLRERHDRIVARLKNEIGIYKEDHVDKSFYFAFFGAIFLTIGFAFQILGALNR